MKTLPLMIATAVISFSVGLCSAVHAPAEQQQWAMAAVQFDGVMLNADPERRLFNGCAARTDGNLIVTVSDGWRYILPERRESFAAHLSENWTTATRTNSTAVYFEDDQGNSLGWAENGSTHLNQ